jgi:hypothetical protein
MHVDSIETIQERLTQILERVASDHDHLLAALSNPLLALEDAGFRPNQEVRDEIEDRCRFDKRGIVVRRALREQIFRQTEGSFDLADTPKAVEAIARHSDVDEAAATTALDPERHVDHVHELPTEGASLADLVAHYRALDAQFPSFVDRSTYDAIAAGHRSSSITALTVRRHASSEVLARTTATPRRSTDA